MYSSEPSAKMIWGIFILSLLAVAYAQPPYADSADDIEDAIKELEDQILSLDGNIPNITDSRRHYAPLLTHIAQVAASIALNCDLDYEQVYIEKLPESIAIGLTNVDDVISVTSTAIDSLHNNTQKMQDLMEALCLEPTPNEVCSQLIDQAVEGDPVRYKEEAEIMLLAGTVANELLDADLISVAEDHDEIDYLLDNVDDLEDLIMHLVDLIRLTDGKSRCE